MDTISGTASIPLRQFTLAKAADFLRLTKPKLTSLVLFTTLTGFYLGSRGPVSVPLLIHTLIGAALAAGGTAAFNMYRERGLDARMKRTSLRPLATGRLASRQALIFAIAVFAGGFAYLFVLVNPVTSLLAAAIFASYILLYTPLKTKTWLCTFIGAVPGALPPVMGWAASDKALAPGAACLFLILLFWQIPHFYAIGWIHREDYAAAGLPVLSVKDPDGRKTSRLAALFIVFLIFLSLVPLPLGLAGRTYAGGAIALGLIYLGYAVQFARLRDAGAARKLFAASAFYLPALFILLALNKSAAP